MATPPNFDSTHRYVRKPDRATYEQRRREQLAGKTQPANENASPVVIDIEAARAAIRRQQREQVSAERADLVGTYCADVDRGLGRRMLKTWV